MSACHKSAPHRLGLLASEGDNVEKFLMGRQVFVVLIINLFIDLFIYISAGCPTKIYLYYQWY